MYKLQEARSPRWVFVTVCSPLGSKVFRTSPGRALGYSLSSSGAQARAGGVLQATSTEVVLTLVVVGRVGVANAANLHVESAAGDRLLETSGSALVPLESPAAA